jgi:hypothetical protein
MPHNLDKLKRTFGAIAEQYDSVRPGYPASVIDAILALFGAETLRSTPDFGRLLPPPTKMLISPVRTLLLTATRYFTCIPSGLTSESLQVNYNKE